MIVNFQTYFVGKAFMNMKRYPTKTISSSGIVHLAELPCKNDSKPHTPVRSREAR